MSYQKKIKYCVTDEVIDEGSLKHMEVPNPVKDSYSVIRNCQGCGKKTLYINSGNFRVNANGNRIDVWLIYRCAKCRHTYNLTIYERKRPDEIPSGEYDRFLDNDKELAIAYGKRKDIFIKNKAYINAGK